jgi:hypothetical protein
MASMERTQTRQARHNEVWIVVVRVIQPPTQPPLGTTTEFETAENGEASALKTVRVVAKSASVFWFPFSPEFGEPCLFSLQFFCVYVCSLKPLALLSDRDHLDFLGS